jgi:hypothetical protein
VRLRQPELVLALLQLQLLVALHLHQSLSQLLLQTQEMLH